MIEVTEDGLEKLKAFQAEENSEKPLRLAIVSGSSSSSNLGFVPDLPTELDDVFDFEGFKLVIDKKLMEFLELVQIDFVKTEKDGCSADGGFKITPKNSL